ncbi:MAG TPA: hypothetical protein VGM63_15180 [Mucilaginibacter sp.]|jgi:hypothetical protein
MKLDLEKIIIPANYVLIKLDQDFNTYQNPDTGRDTNISIAPWGINQATHLSVTGIVMALPKILLYHGYLINVMKQEKDRSDSRQKEIANLRRESIAYDVPMELAIGMRVYFEYTTRLDAFKEGRRIECEDGEYILIQYDSLIMAFRDDTDFEKVKITDVWMLNGMVLVKPLEYAVEKTADGIRGVKTEMDLFIPESKQPNARYVKKGNVWYGSVIRIGCPVKSYADFPGRGGEVNSSQNPIKPGIKISYDGRQQKRLEQPLHRVIFREHVFYRIHRKDIIAVYPDGKIN